MDFVYQNGTLDGTGVQIVNVGGKAAPMMATLASAAGGRKIELSTDGTNYYAAAAGASVTNMINSAIPTPVLYVKFTGVAADTWNIR